MKRGQFIRKMNTTRAIYLNAYKREQKIFDALEKQFPDVNLDKCHTNAKDAKDITEAIICYLLYGEYTPEQIWDEIEKENNKHK